MRDKELEKWLGEENFLGMDIWEKKYQYNGESFEEWLERVSNGNKAIKRLILDKKWLPAGRILANRGLNERGRKVSYSNCYVMPRPKDSIEGIFDAAKQLARTYSYGGGCGIDISNLAPAGARVRNAADTTTGAVSFMPLYDLVTELIGQKGRRGALMISISCEHPSIREFLEIKSDLNKITHANISVRFTDAFMEAVRSKKDIIVRFTRPETGQTIVDEFNAYEFMKKFAELNWDYAEPGALFWDRINRWCIVSEDEEFEFAGVNPCAEEPLPAFGSCLLSSFNLSQYVYTSIITGSKGFDFPGLRNDVRTVVQEMNTILDEGAGLHPINGQTICALDWRQVGIGIMGLADLLVKMELPYGSPQANNLCDKIGACLADAALMESALLAKESGPYLKYKEEAILASPYILHNASSKTLEAIKKYGLRNSQLLTIAPTGTLSTMLGISGGIEPIFAFHYTRLTKTLHDEGDKEYKVYTKIVKDYMDKNGLEDDSKLPAYFVSAHMLDYNQRIKVQSIWQRHIDASISSTVNLPNEATPEMVLDLYLKAWEQNLKGITIYRDGCRRSGILSTNNEAEEVRLERGDWKPLAEDTVYYPKKIYTGCGKLKLMIGYSKKEESLQDLYVVRSGKGGCERNIQSTIIAMSGMLRLGGNLFNLEKAFEGISACPSFASAKAKGKEVSPGSSCGAAMLKAIKEFMVEIGEGDKCIKTPKKEVPMTDSNMGKVCPECQTELRNQEGCVTCPNCGYTKCES